MRVVLLTGDDLEHRYVATVLAAELELSLVAIITASSPTFFQRLRSWWRRYTLSQLASRIFARACRRLLRLDEKRRRTFECILFNGDPPPTLPLAERRHHVSGHNAPDCLALLDQLKPDVIVVYGTGLIRSSTLGTARAGAINLHTGLSPYFRGADTIFWALHEGHPELVGATVHKVVPGIDAGAILYSVTPDISTDDDEDSLFAKSLLSATPLLALAAREVASGTATSIAQDLSLGREFRFVDRSARAEARVRRAIRDGLLRRFGTQTR